MMNKVLVCGGTNLVGPYVIEGLLEKGYEITVLTRGNREVPFRNCVRHILADTNFYEDIENAIKGESFDAVIDTIAYCPQQVINILSNIETPRYIQVSSIAVYEPSSRFIGEEAFDPITYDKEKLLTYSVDYSDRKRAAEGIAYQRFSQCLPICVRPAYVFDTRQPYHRMNVRLWEIVNWIKNGIPIDSRNNDLWCSFTDAKEEAQIIVDLVESVYNKPINITSRGNVTVAQIIAYMEERIQKKAEYDDMGLIHGFQGGKRIDISRLLGIRGKVSVLNDWLWKLIDIYVDNEGEFAYSWSMIRDEMDSGNKVLQNYRMCGLK